MIPYEDLKRLNHLFIQQFRDKFDSVLEKGHYILGEEVALFEKDFAAFNAAPYCVGVSNGLILITTVK